MSWSAVGSFFQTADATVSVDPQAVGDVLLIEVLCFSSGVTAYCSGITGGNCTWTQLGTKLTSTSGNECTAVVFQGVATATGTATATFAISGSASTVIAAGQEFRSSVGSWALDGTQGSIDTQGSNANWATLTPSGSGGLYFGYAYDYESSAIAGTTSGFVYDIDGVGCGMGYCLSVSAAYTPVWGDTSQGTGIMVLLKETGAAATSTPAPLQAGSTWRRRFRPRAMLSPPPTPALPPPEVPYPQAKPGKTWKRHYRAGEIGPMHPLQPGANQPPVYRPSGTPARPGRTWRRRFKHPAQIISFPTPGITVPISTATVTIATPAPGISGAGVALGTCTVTISAPGIALGFALSPATVTIATPAPGISGAGVALGVCTLTIATPGVTPITIDPQPALPILPGKTWRRRFKHRTQVAPRTISPVYQPSGVPADPGKTWRRKFRQRRPPPWQSRESVYVHLGVCTLTIAVPRIGTPPVAVDLGTATVSITVPPIKFSRQLLISLASQAGQDDYGNSYPQGILATEGVIEGPTIVGSDAFFYDPSPGFGNLAQSITAADGTDQYGNAYIAGTSTYADNGSFWSAVVIADGVVTWYEASGPGGPWTSEAGIGFSWNSSTGGGLIFTGTAGNSMSGDLSVTGSVTASVTLTVNGTDVGATLSAIISALSGAATSTDGLPNGQITGTSGAQSAGTAHTHGGGSYAVTNGQHSHNLPTV